MFQNLFPTFDGGLDAADRTKANALLGVVCKSTASLGDVVKLADALGLNLQLQAKSKPKDTPEAPERNSN